MSNEKLAEALRELFVKWLESRSPFRTTVEVEAAWEGWKANTAIAAMLAAEITEPVAWSCQDTINDDDGCPIGMDEPRVHWGSGCPDDDGGWSPLYGRPQPAQDASNPLKGWIFDKVNMGHGDERYICTPDGANATTVRNESTSDHRERLLWLIADAMAKESGR